MRMIETLVGLEPAISRIRVTLLLRLRVVVALDTVVLSFKHSYDLSHTACCSHFKITSALTVKQLTDADIEFAIVACERWCFNKASVNVHIASVNRQFITILHHVRIIYIIWLFYKT